LFLYLSYGKFEGVKPDPEKFCKEKGFFCGKHDYGSCEQIICGVEGKCSKNGAICRTDSKCVICDDSVDPEQKVEQNYAGTCEIWFYNLESKHIIEDDEFYDDVCSKENIGCITEGFEGTFLANQYYCGKDKMEGFCVKDGKSVCLDKGGAPNGVCCGDKDVGNGDYLGYCKNLDT